jgi:tetratricopeptide (TPR) repeat protein
MQFYQSTATNKIAGINRSFFDAEHGRVKLAIDRLQDLSHRFHEDAQINYAEGLIRKDRLGQGIKACSLFQKAYELDHNHAFAAVNAAKYSQNENEFRRWADIAIALSPKDRSVKLFVNEILENLNNNIPYWRILTYGGQRHFEAGKLGDGAALLELAFLTGKLDPDEEVRARRVRAQSIRALDAEEQRHRDAGLEHFPPDERLALFEALSEIERAIGLDEYDPELWNLKSAWLSYITRYEESIRCAERSISLRPYKYAKPYMNKANVLWAMGRDSEALLYAQETLKQAESSGLVEDIDKARNMVKDFSQQRKKPDIESVKLVAVQMLRSATVNVDLELGQRKSSAGKMMNGILKHARSFPKIMDYMPMMAELFDSVTPETLSYIILSTAKKNLKVHDNCLHAALYLLSKAEGVSRRDAARFLALSIFGAVEGLAIRKVYREAILETSAAAHGAMSHLDKIMREELGRINPSFPRLIADQELIDENGRLRAARNILSRFQGYDM